MSTVSTELAPKGGADAELPLGSPVGEYTIDAVLGRGGFGTVYRGVHPVIGKQVAIKVLARKYASDPDIISRFAAEARAVNQIRHRNIIDIFQFSTLPDGRHYYVMECLDGEPLDQYLADHGPLGLAEALPILRAIGRALDAAHAKGIAHRDLKPENIFLARDADGERFPKLLDFGIAKLFGSGADSALHRTATGVPIGTPYYMSPEQCRGKDVDQRTDVYSFGIVAYRMLTNTYPFDGPDYVELLFQQVNEEAPPPSSRNPALPATVDAAIAWMMRKDRDQRPATLHEALGAFDDAREPGVTTPPVIAGAGRPAITPNAFAQTAASTLKPAPPKKPARKPAVWIGATLVLVCSAAGAMLVMKSSNDQAPPSRERHDEGPANTTAAYRPPVVAQPPTETGVVATTVKLRLPKLPPHAKVTFGDTVETVADGAIVVPETTEFAALTIEAPGYVTVHVQVAPDRDQTIGASYKKATITHDPLATPPSDSHGIEGSGFQEGCPLIRILALALLASCSGLDSLEASCGNGVVEPGEDCDSPESTCRSCSITCSIDDPCASPYFCGADQLCHAAGGRFRGETAAIPFEVQGFGVTDINGDGYGDVVALGGTSFTTYEGNAAGTLVDRTELTSPVLQGVPAVTKLDPGPTLDLVLPTVDGLLAYTSPAHVPSPFPFPVDITPTAGQPQPLYVFPVSKADLGLLVANPDGSLAISIINGDVRGNPSTSIIATTAVCNFGVDELADPLGRDNYVTATSHLITVTSTHGVTCEIEVNSSSFVVVSHTVPGVIATPKTHAWFARLETGGACPSLLIQTPSGMVEATAAGSPLPVLGCSTASNTTLVDYTAAFAPLGHVVIDPSLPDALITTAGIFTISATGLTTRALYVPVRPMDSVTTVDINGDGLEDVIASSRMFDDLDVLVRYNPSATAAFLPRSIDTVGVPLNVVTGDFDGDGVGDVTYTEKLVDTERLMIAFGGHDAIEPARFVSSFTDVIETSTINLTSSSDPLAERVVDLFVLDRPTGPSTSTLLLTVLFGNPERTLLPYFDPRETGVKSIGFHGVIAGSFDPAPSAYEDLFAIEELETGTTVSYLIEPSPLGAMSTAGKVDSPGFLVCQGNSGAAHDSGLCVDGAQLIPFRSDASQSHALVFGLDVDPAYDVVFFDPLAIAGSQPLSMTVASMRDLGLVTAPNMAPHQVYVADIDGDGTNELVAGYGPDVGGNDKTVGSIVVCNAEGMAIACHALTMPDLDGWACGDATPANVVEYQRFVSPAPRISADLVAVCRRPDRPKAELMHIWFADAAFHAEEMFALPLDTIYVKASDVTGDGVDDILAFERASPVPLLHIYPQCTSRDRDGCPTLDGEKPR